MIQLYDIVYELFLLHEQLTNFIYFFYDKIKVEDGIILVEHKGIGAALCVISSFIKGKLKKLLMQTWFDVDIARLVWKENICY